jgi:sec-independent protein translocase protein TatA
MGLDNPLHIAVLLLILLMVFGAKRLPELGRSLGTGMRGFKESISGEGHATEHVEQLAATPAEAIPATQAMTTPTISADEPVAARPVRPVA